MTQQVPGRPQFGQLYWAVLYGADLDAAGDDPVVTLRGSAYGVRVHGVPPAHYRATIARVYLTREAAEVELAAVPARFRFTGEPTRASVRQISMRKADPAADRAWAIVDTVPVYRGT